jgi:2-dehydro-3-deoxyphosphogluconate aldolase/(4S)-4-hydroxy-2-oxoglutarate aldolase
MKRVACLTKIKETGLVAVVRAKSVEQAVKASEAIVAGGILGIELTFSVPRAEEAIAQLVERFKDEKEVVIGAGTVLDAISARQAIFAGAQFIVSPSFDEETAKCCNLYQVAYLPGCLTPTEMTQALAFGSDIVKLFPCSAFSPSIISSLHAPLPQLNIMPTGGVCLANMEDWLRAGATAIGIGGELLKPLATENYAEITAIAKKYVAKLEEVRGEMR